MQLSPELIKAAAARLQEIDLQERFDAYQPGSRPTKFQQEILDDFLKIRTQFVVAGNRAGKTQMAARIMAWMLAENMPGWKRPERWGTAPLLFMIMSRTLSQGDDAIWRKIKGFFKEDEVREVRIGQQIKKVIHKGTGNTLLFESHDNVTQARERVQAFELAGVILDEMPKSYLLFEELQRRVQDKQGFFITTFTPKVKNNEIRKIVDAAEPPYSKRYKLKMFDNPTYTDEMKAHELKSLEGYPEDYVKCVLEGEWLASDLAVYQLDEKRIVRPLPEYYSSGWRHVESSDPALQSKHGQIVFAEDPSTKHWYITKADYITGIQVPSELVKTATDRLKHLNIVRRVCDPASTWYIGEASKMGFSYICPPGKTNGERRAEMMKNLQQRLGQDVFLTPGTEDLLQELFSMEWSESQADKVVNSRKYHLHDATIYGLDCLPPPEKTQVVPDYWERIHQIKEAQERAMLRKAKRQTQALRYRW